MTDKRLVAYVQHGSGAEGPFLTEEVATRYRPHSKPQGRGPIATYWEVRTAGRWRRLRVSTSTSPSMFVTIDRKRVKVWAVEV